MTTSRIAAIAATTALFAGGLAIAGCGGSTTTVPTEADGASYSEVESSNGDGQSAITASVGGKVVVRFNCNPGTGYSWDIAASGDTILARKGETECTPDDAEAAADGAVGLSGHYFRTYEVTTAGTETLTFTWVGPGRDRTPEATQVLKVTAS